MRRRSKVIPVDKPPVLSDEKIINAYGKRLKLPLRDIGMYFYHGDGGKAIAKAQRDADIKWFERRIP